MPALTKLDRVIVESMKFGARDFIYRHKSPEVVLKKKTPSPPGAERGWEIVSLYMLCNETNLKRHYR